MHSDNYYVFLPCSTYYHLFAVGAAWGRPELPLVILEDDVILHPSFSRALNTLAASAQAQAGPARPWFTTMYNHHAQGIAPTPEILTRYKARYHTRPRPGPVVASTWYQWKYGAQGLVLSPGMVRQMLLHFQRMTVGAEASVGYQDMLLRNWLQRHKCRHSYARCAVFVASPSLVEHVGVSSGLFGANNSRFHISYDFPLRVRMPALDAPGSWS